MGPPGDSLAIVVVEVLNLADLSPPTAVFWSLTGVLLLVFLAPVVVRHRIPGFVACWLLANVVLMVIRVRRSRRRD